MFMENFCPAGLDIELVKLHLLSYGCKGSELKKWINLCNILYIMGARRGVYRVLLGKPEKKETTWKTQV